MAMPMNDVIIVLPGIMGSALAKDGRAVWDIDAEAIGRALLSLGGSISDLALSSDDSTGDGVTATHLLADVHLIPRFWKIDGYSDLTKLIRSRFEVTPGENFFEFPYDWRLDNRISARRLASVAKEWLERWREHHPGARLILIAHSMGGLVARYFLEVLEGWRDTRMLITLGTPYRGSIKALDYLVNGIRIKWVPITLSSFTTLAKSSPSVYQLLPIFPCIAEPGEQLSRISELEEIGPLDMDRARAGIAFHTEIRRAVEANLLRSDYQDSRYTIIPMVGVHQRTFLSAVLTPDGIEPIATYNGDARLGGDGTVPRFSATPIELSNARVETFAACPHAGLQNFEPLCVQLTSKIGDTDISQIMASETEPISLSMEDAFSTDEPFLALARCGTAIDPLQATLVHIESGRKMEYEFEMPSGEEGWQRLEIASLAAGTYRIHLDAGDEAAPITDVFCILE